MRPLQYFGKIVAVKMRNPTITSPFNYAKGSVIVGHPFWLEALLH